ncbi:Undecaprenyl-phosphate alpha-N-acetylglucosaminyl 1-phosphate transferase [Escherichia coli]|nr:Undecaprenyl-phosphate alpha-N-acetylglucosaminyl 1-phosphate transferase [Escherichia coli]
MNLLTVSTDLISIFLFTTLFLFFARKVAKKVGLVDKPNFRKRHQGLIPLVGGFRFTQGFASRSELSITIFRMHLSISLVPVCLFSLARWMTVLISA